MVKNRILIAGLLLVLFLGRTIAQDYSFRQPLFWKSYYNPAYTGIERGVSFNLGYQREFVKLPAKFESQIFSVDYSLYSEKRNNGVGGVGLFVTNDLQGDGRYRVNTVGSSFSVRVPMGRSSFVQFGLRPSFYFVSVNPDRFILGDQLDPYGGVVLPRSPLLSSGIPDKINLFDLNWGFYWRNYFDNARNSFFSNAVLDLGFAVDHLPQHDQSFLKGSNSADRSVPLPTKYVGMIDYGMPVWVPDPDYPLFMTTYALWEQQGEFKNLQLGTNFEIDRVLAGFSVRTQQFEISNLSSMIFNLGLFPDVQNNLRISYSLDVPVYNGLMNRNFSHEITISYLIPQGRQQYRKGYLAGYRKNRFGHYTCPVPGKQYKNYRNR